MTKFNIDEWLNIILDKLKYTFKERLIFAGLQGSYSRGEATDKSDIDLVIILDELDFDDLKQYRKIIDSMPDKEKACGFISGKKELKEWSKTDLFQFFYDTKPLIGNLFDITEPPSIIDIKTSIKTGLENIYHGASHSYLHSDNHKEDLINLYKMTFFILQAKYFIKTDTYVKTKLELAQKLTGIDKEMLDICINKDDILNKNTKEIEKLYEKLIEWSCLENK